MTHFDITRWVKLIYLSLFPVVGIAAGYLTASIIGVILSETPSPSPIQETVSVVSTTAKQNYQTITNRNIFDSAASEKTGEVVSEISEVGSPAEIAPVRIDLTLLGTVVAGRDSLAIIKGGKEIEIFHLGDELPGGGSVDSIERKAVFVLMPSGEMQVIKIDEKGATIARNQAQTRQRPSEPQKPSETAITNNLSGIEQIGENKWLIPKAEADRSRQNLSELLKTARMTPNIIEGQTVGFRLAWLKKSSFLETLGLKKGDILLEVNGTDLDGPEKALQIFQQLREARRLTIGFDRRGEKLSYEYEIN